MYLNSFPGLPWGRSWSAAYQQAAGGGWSFDPLSFAIGFVAALLLVLLAFRRREQIAQYREQLAEQAQQLRQRFTANMASRYSSSIIETAQTMHMWGALAPLGQIYVDVRLYAPLALIADETHTGMPPQYPSEHIIQASDRLVIVGDPGSGRTMLLNHLLLRQAARLHAAGEGARAPVYVYLPVLVTQGKSSPAARLVEAALASTSRLVASGAARWLQEQVKSGNALILLDDWDQVPAAERPAVTEWLQELFNAYPGNRIIVTTGERGYAPLIEAGLAMLRLAPWTRHQLLELTRRWVEAFPRSSKEDRPLAPRISYRLTPPTPLQATIELMIQLHRGAPASVPADRMQQVLDLIFPPPELDKRGELPWPPETGQRALERLALAALGRGGLLEREEIQVAVAEALPPPSFELGEEPEEGFDKSELKAAQEEQERRTLQVVDCCRDLTAPGAPLRDWGNRRYLFNHPLIVAYLAARHLAAEASIEGVVTIVEHADVWTKTNVLRFYVGLSPARPVIKRLMSAADDLFLSRLWLAAAMLTGAPPEGQQWRKALMTRLAQLLMNPKLPELLRNRALQALVDSGEEAVGSFLRQMAGHPDAHLRAGAMMGLGALEREQDLPLVEAALGDAELPVRLAAINALGRLSLAGNEHASELIMATMIESGAEVQRVSAELLADMGPEGESVLREAAKDEDLMLRRASVFGLAILNAPWAIEILEHIRREDKEWLVRNAAAEALEAMSEDEEKRAPDLDISLPQADAEPWLIALASERGESLGSGKAAEDVLLRVLEDDDPNVRLMAIETLERLALPRAVGALRQLLRDQYPEIRHAALDALDEIGRRHDIVISPR